MQKTGNFLGSPVVKTSPSNAGGAGSIPGQEFNIPHDVQVKNQNIEKKKSNIVTNSIKTLKVVHIQKDLEEKKCKSQCSFIGGAWIWPVNHSGL